MAPISFRVGTIGPIPAKVLWPEQSMVGSEFDTPLHPSVLDHSIRTMDQAGKID